MAGGTFRRQYGSGHTYYLDGVKVPGVTTMTKGFPMDLTKWAAETTAGYAIDHWDTLAGMSPSERLKTMAKAPWADRDTAAARGTRVHKLAEPLSRGEEITVPEDLRGYVESCAAFLDDYKIKPILVEPAVFSRKYQYGGAADLFAWAAVPGAGPVRVLADYKTKRGGIWGDEAFQLAGYRYAEFYLDGDGAEQPLPQVDECWGVWVRPDGYDVYPMEVTPAVFRQLLYADQVRRAKEEARNYRGDPLPHPRDIA